MDDGYRHASLPISILKSHGGRQNKIRETGSSGRRDSLQRIELTTGSGNSHAAIVQSLPPKRQSTIDLSIEHRRQ